MNIKTITCHNVYNFGASLQAYALTAYLKNSGHNVKIIDYQPFYLRHYRLTGVSNPRFDRPFFRQAVPAQPPVPSQRRAEVVKYKLKKLNSRNSSYSI